MATIIRTEDDKRDASIFLLRACYSFKTHFLIQAEQPYVTVSSVSGIESGFADFRFRIRATLVSRPGASVFFLTGLRTGSGSREVFPFASGSIDAEFGWAVVDTLSSFILLGAATTAFVWRGPETFDEATAHGNHLIVNVGISFPVRESVDVAFLGTGYVLTSGAFRELYAIQGSYKPSTFFGFFGSLQAEGGKEKERVSDFAITAGVRIFY
ncbi:MAG: hypothetical protein GTO51_09315 [Candidatus Latescibacteria bacterium]|nr:hypothetical protein [Candidatus Latescibacterota bacterium]NIM22341.1 hypothetical protein [Candidatus Latescibacterota bacterium]NIM66171.1 hypothetical protein [Candidatus Latescibacterota bacterium]NIO02579.1 hypothetical protein [Candidatus Latescibacterota bacterium]NIO29493.1 hypothetical protein [Candidatus Latescibacterota bacterium]